MRCSTGLGWLLDFPQHGQLTCCMMSKADLPRNRIEFVRKARSQARKRRTPRIIPRVVNSKGLVLHIFPTAIPPDRASFSLRQPS